MLFMPICSANIRSDKCVSSKNYSEIVYVWRVIDDIVLSIKNEPDAPLELTLKRREHMSLLSNYVMVISVRSLFGDQDGGFSPSVCNFNRDRIKETALLRKTSLLILKRGEKENAKNATDDTSAIAKKLV